MKNPHRVASLSAFICSIMLLSCVWAILIFVPEFWQSLAGKIRVINAHPILVKLWYFCIWIVPGIFIVLFNYAMISGRAKKESFLSFVVVASFVDAFYAFCIGAISIFSSNPEIIAGVAPDKVSTTNLHFLFNVLWQLRLSTEPFSESWILLFNLWLFRRTRIHKAIPTAGILMVCYLYVLLLPYFSDWQFDMSMIYIHLKCLWFLVIGIWLWQHPRAREQ